MTFIARSLYASLLLLATAASIVLSSSPGLAADKSLSPLLREDAMGLYLTHIPGVFSLHAARVGTGISYSGTIRDPGGWVHLTRAHDPEREMVIERLSRDTLRFLVAPTSRSHVTGFSFETSTGCFTLKARVLPSGRYPRLHLNGYAPVVKNFPVILCGNGSHVRIEWQGPLPVIKKTSRGKG